ncbi:hypothetical protein [Kosakonia cowanii]|jgi:hypothetical protein|uniref:hypothetical protein n=1 Tax=Kosakonia cowanii TaxID=208223 RepID=UPI00273216AF|nr:hypothetical protein [Kosakonia cowanii]WKW42071.1 hypothetical protein PZO50_21100 [Kosakonia cowanii]
MAKELRKRSDIEKMVAAGEAVKEQPRQVIRETSTGRIISNYRLSEMLPTYLIAMQPNTFIYNDIDVEAFNQEVRQQVSRILDAMRDERFENAGIAYQQFIDQYDACFEMPSTEVLADVKRRGIDLYAVLEHQGNRLTAEMGVGHNPNDESVRRFYAVTEAHINLFFYMLTLNLALQNKIDNAQKQLRTKLGLLEARLRTLLNEYIYADQTGYIPDGKPASKTLYGWILLKQNDLSAAWSIYCADSAPKKHAQFTDLHAAVMSVYETAKYDSVDSIRNTAFYNGGLSDCRAQIASRLCFYLSQTKQIQAYLDELTQGSENNETEDATVDVRSLLIPSTPLIAKQ